MTTSAEQLSRPNSGVGRGWLLALAISLLTSLIVVSPFIWLGNASGHDFQFHAGSWLDAAGQWKEGIIYPRWSEWANHGFGEPRFIFYPPMSWMLGAALGLAVPWNHVPVVFIVLVQTLAGMSAFAFARRMLPDRGALLAAGCYAANPYALLIIYMRSDFAELLAMAFFPLLFLAALEISGLLENRNASARPSVVFFAAMFAAVWLSNAPAGVLASYSCALLFAWASLTERSWRLLARGAAGLALGFGLAGFYLAPAAYEQRWVNISQALSAGLPPSQNFLYAQINDPEHNFFNMIASSVAVLMIVLAGIAATAEHRKAAKSAVSSGESKMWRALFVLCVAATVLMLRFTSLLWDALPELRFVQFPWRWMAILAVPFAFFLGAAMGRQRWWWLWTGAVLAVLSGTGMVLVQRAWWDTEDIPVLRASVANGGGFDGTDEYDPVGDDHYNLPEKAPLVSQLQTESGDSVAAAPAIHVERWTAEEKQVRVSSRVPLQVSLRVLIYPAWRVEVNGTAVTPERPEDSGQMIVSVPAGESQISVRFLRTKDRTFGGVLSAASLAATLILLCWPERK